MSDWSVLNALAQGGANRRDLEDLRFVDVPDAEGAANMAKGVASGSIGMGGDLEMLAKALVDLNLQSKGINSFSGPSETLLPTSEDVGNWFGADTESTGFQSGTFFSPDPASKLSHLLPLIYVAKKMDFDKIMQARKMLSDMPKNPFRQQELLHDIERETGLVGVTDKNSPNDYSLFYQTEPGKFEPPKVAPRADESIPLGKMYENRDLDEAGIAYKDVPVFFDVSNGGGYYSPSNKSIHVDRKENMFISDEDMMELGIPAIVGHETDHYLNHTLKKYVGSSPSIEQNLLAKELEASKASNYDPRQWGSYTVKADPDLPITEQDYAEIAMRSDDIAAGESTRLLSDIKDWDGTASELDDILTNRMLKFDSVSNLNYLTASQKAQIRQLRDAHRTALDALNSGVDSNDVLRYLLRMHGNKYSNYVNDVGETAANLSGRQTQRRYQAENTDILGSEDMFRGIRGQPDTPMILKQPRKY